MLAGQLNSFDEQALEDELSQIMAGGEAKPAQPTVASQQPAAAAPSGIPALPTAPTHLPQLSPPAAIEETEESEVPDKRQAVTA